MDYFVRVWLLVSEYIVLRYFLIAGLVFFLIYVLFRQPLAKYRLQAKFPATSDYLRDILYSLITMLIFSVAVTFVLFVGRDYTNLYDSIQDYGIPYYVFTYFWMFFLHDTYFYWAHRLMHHPKLYRYVHLIHHKSTNPSPWTAYAFHPFEAIFEVAIIPLIAFTLPVHLSAITLFMLFQFFYNVYGHLGIEILPAWLRRSYLGRQLNTSTHHNAHHQYVHGNYGLYLLLWDRWMGTMRKENTDNV